LIVIFEDPHGIDSETPALLNLLVDSIANARILLLVNYRPEFRHQWDSKTYYTQLRLDPLGKDSAAAMLYALLSMLLARFSKTTEPALRCASDEWDKRATSRARARVLI
jgi:predicted ATPase